LVITARRCQKASSQGRPVLGEESHTPHSTVEAEKRDTFPKKPIARTAGKKRITGFGWKREKPQLPLEGVHLMY
jgi:hypothetical protein